jgi:hypothetical protein
LAFNSFDRGIELQISDIHRRRHEFDEGGAERRRLRCGRGQAARSKMIERFVQLGSPGFVI